MDRVLLREIEAINEKIDHTLDYADSTDNYLTKSVLIGSIRKLQAEKRGIMLELGLISE